MVTSVQETNQGKTKNSQGSTSMDNKGSESPSIDKEWNQTYFKRQYCPVHYCVFSTTAENYN